MKPFGDAFVAAIRMVIAPIIFCTVVHGIASMQDMKKVGRVGLKALVYFELMTTVALVMGMIVANIWQPGAGMNVDAAPSTPSRSRPTSAAAQNQSARRLILHIIPNSVGGRVRRGRSDAGAVLRVLFAFALHLHGRARQAAAQSDRHCLARALRHRRASSCGRRRSAPSARWPSPSAATASARCFSSASSWRASTHLPALHLRGARRLCRLCGFSVLKFIRYIKEELLIVLGTSSSESVLPRMIAKLENLGCEESVVGLVIPTGYSFNLDGTCIYLTMAALFLAQATDTHLVARQPARHPRRAAADVEGRGGSDRQRLHRARRNAGVRPAKSRSPSIALDPRGGSVHVGSARADQSDRQRCRDNRRREREGALDPARLYRRCSTGRAM